MGNLQTSQHGENPMIPSKKPMVELIPLSTEAHNAVLAKASEGNFATQRANELQWRKLEAQGSQAYSSRKDTINGVVIDRHLPTIQEVKTLATNHQTTSLHPKTDTMRSTYCQPRHISVGCSNPFVYYLPNGTIVDMATRRMYSKQDSNGNTVCSPSTMAMLSSAPALKPQSCTTKNVPEVVDLTLDDSTGDNEDEKEMFPKIVSTFSLNPENSHLAPSDISKILSRKENNNNNNVNGVLANDDKKGFPKTKEMGGSISSGYPWDNICETRRQITDLSGTRNDVMGDVTNLRIDVSTSVKLPFEKSAILDEENATENVAASSLSGSSVVEAQRPVNLEAPAVSQRGCSTHRRKAVLEVRKDFSARSSQDSFTRVHSSRLEGVAMPSECDDGSTGTPWTFTIKPSVPKPSKPTVSRQAKLKELKRLLSTQEKAVEKLRVNGHKVTGKKRKPQRSLVAKIPALSAQLLREICRGKRSFCVRTASDGKTLLDDAPLLDVPLTRKSRKSSTRKLIRGYTYPSYVSFENLVKFKDSKKKSNVVGRIKQSYSPQDSPCSSDSEDVDATYEPSVKRARGRPRSEKGAKQKGQHCNRGRNSPIGAEFYSVVVVSKDLWHRELEKVEVAIASSDKPIDQESYLMFLGLRRA